MFSVVIPLYNVEQYIERAIYSVLSQTVLPSEILIVDDGSTDNSLKRVEGINSSLIRVIKQPHMGVSEARNRGIIEARYDFIAFIDGDDEWNINHLKIIRNLIDKYPNCGMYATSYLFKYAQTGLLVKPTIKKKFSFNGEDGILDNYFDILAGGINGPFNMDTIVVRKSLFSLIGGFPKGVNAGEDLYIYARIFIESTIAYSKLSTSIYYIGLDNKTSRVFLKENPADKMIDALIEYNKDILGIKKFISFWHRNRMTCAILSRNYDVALREFIVAYKYQPFSVKILLSLISTLKKVLMGEDWISLAKKKKMK